MAQRKSLSSSDSGVDLYREAIKSSLNACVPLKFTGGLAGALAGRPIMIRYVDNRDLGKQSGTP